MKNTYVKSLILSLLIGLSSHFVQAQTTKFQRILGGKGDDRSYSMVQTKDGGYILTGYTKSYGAGGEDAYLIKTNALGKIEWSKAYGTSGNETGWKVKQTNDSGYIVAGTISTKNGDGLLYKTKQDGTVQWGIVFDTDSAEDIYNVLESRLTGDIYVTGYIKTRDTMGTDAFISKFSSSGSFIWQRRIGGAGNEEGYALAEDQKGNIAIVGVVVDDTVTVGGKLGAVEDQDIFISRFDSKGNHKWTRNYGSNNKDQAWDIKYSQGFYVIAGWTESGPGTTDALISIIDTVGTVYNSYTYGGTGSSKAFSVVINPDDSYSLTGYVDAGPNRDAYYLNTDKTGIVNAYSTLGGTSTDGHWPSEITRTIDGGFTIFTSSNSFKSSNSNDLYLVRMDNKGITQCNQAVSSPNNFGFNLTSSHFAKVSFGANFSSKSLTTNTMSSVFDSVLCCKLQSQTAGSSLRVCKGEGVRLGKTYLPGYVYKWTQVGGSYTSSDPSPLVFPTGSATYKLVVTSSDGKCAADSSTISVSLKADLKNRNFVRDTFFCVGDTVTVTARSGMIDYSWKGKKTSANGKTVKLTQADTIILTVTDTTTCKYNDTFKVVQKKLPTFSLGNDTTICENTKITLSGPANMKSYLWNGGQATTRTYQTNEEKTHTLAVIDSFGCKASDSKVLFINPASSFSLGRDTTICKGVNYTIIGPGFMTNFFWNGVSSFSANKTINDGGTYILEASNSFGCKHKDTIVIGLKKDPTFSLGPDGGVCNSGGRVLRGPSKMAGYKWDDGSTDSTYSVFNAGTYWLRVTGPNGCIFTDSIKLVKVNNPTPELGKDTTICEKDSIYLDAGPYVSFKWNSGETTRILKVKKAGLYEVTVTDANTCQGVDDKSVKTKFCFDNIAQYNKIKGLKVYPNPVGNELNIEWLVKYPDATLAIYHMDGRKVFEQKGEPGLGKYRIDVSEYTRGVYYLKVSTGKTEESLKLILD